MTDSQMDAPELLPCPFCGGKAVVIRPDHHFPYVACIAGFCTGPKHTVPLAVEAWNRRATPTVLAEDPAVKALVAEAEARGMERAWPTVRKVICSKDWTDTDGDVFCEVIENAIRAEAALTKVARLGQEWDADTEAQASKAHEKEIAVWSENYAALERERDRWIEGAGAHHVASMQQAQRADRAEAALSAAQQRIKLLCDNDEWNLGLQEALESIRAKAAAIRNAGEAK